jgi:hypothetical protein
MTSRALAACFSITACGAPTAVQKTEPIPTVTATATIATNDAAATPEACLPKTTAKAALVDLSVSGDHALACYEDTCADVDLRSAKLVRTQKWNHVDAPVAAPPTPSFTTTTSNSVTVCKRDAPKAPCTTIQVRPSLDAGHGGTERTDVIAALSDDGARLFVFAPEVASGADRKFTTSWTTYGDTYDVKTRKRVFHQRLTTPQDRIFSDYSNMWSASWVGDNLLLGDYVCCGPGGASMLFDPEHGTIERVHGYGGSFTHVSGSIYAVIDQKTLAFVDAATLRDVGAPIAAPGKPVDSSESASALVQVGSSAIVFAYANPPGVIVIDAASQTRSAEVTLPLCP